MTGQAARPASFSFREAGHLSPVKNTGDRSQETEVRIQVAGYLGLCLTDEQYQRYLEVRHKVEKAIAHGTRTPGGKRIAKQIAEQIARRNKSGTYD